MLNHPKMPPALNEQMAKLYRDVYFGLGTPDAAPVALGAVLPELRRIAAEVSGSLLRP